MRVIAGAARGRRLHAVKGQAVRPTADRVKEALFSILGSRYDIGGSMLLDLYAGTGALGIEALSRGAAHVTFIEQHAATCRVLRENVARCGFTDDATVICAPVERALHTIGESVYQGAFLDPPYGRGLVTAALEQLARLSLLRADAWVVAEHHVDDALGASYGSLHLTHTRRYGKTTLSLFQGNGD